MEQSNERSALGATSSRSGEFDRQQAEGDRAAGGTDSFPCDFPVQFCLGQQQRIAVAIERGSVSESMDQRADHGGGLASELRPGPLAAEQRYGVLRVSRY